MLIFGSTRDSQDRRQLAHIFSSKMEEAVTFGKRLEKRGNQREM
jgi:hypothetical protein